MATRKETIDELVRNIKRDELYFYSDRRCFQFISANPENHQKLIVNEKLSAINNGVIESEFVPDFVEHILELNIDPALQNGDLEIVEAIAAIRPDNPRKFRKVASMYCNFHRPRIYPIQTEIAEELLALFVTHVVPDKGLPADLIPYPDFKSVTDFFIDMYDFHAFDYYELEKFLWLKADLVRDYFTDPKRDERFDR